MWVYPHFDNRFVAQSIMEKVIVGEYSEEIPYDPEFDRYALVYDVEPGQLLTWPQNAPHRVTNLEGLNVSLSTEHMNPRAVRRVNVHTANHFLRRTFRGQWSANVEGPAAHLKQTLARVVRLGEKLFQGKQSTAFDYGKTFVVDPAAEKGFRILHEDPAAKASHQLELAAE